MNEIVWVCGNAAVGKETFIRHIAQKKDMALLRALGWADAHIEVVEESIEWVAYDPEHPFREKRNELPKLLAKRVAGESARRIFLMKGQFVDFEAHRPEELAAILPDVSHTVLFLDAPHADTFARLQKKPWYKKHFNIERVQRLSQHEVALLKKLDVRFRRVVVESGNEYRYSVKKTTENLSAYV